MYAISAGGQTLGGNAVFGFLKQANTAQLSALGGINITSGGKDVGMSFHNPALLRKETLITLFNWQLRIPLIV